MPTGEIIFERFRLIQQEPIRPITPLDLPPNTLSDCCEDWLVLADEFSDDPFKNDCPSFIMLYSELITGVTFTIQKKEDCVWVDKALVSDLTYGEFFDFGFFCNGVLEKGIGLQTNFKVLLTAFGQGLYRIKTEETLITAEVINNYSPVYDVKQYTTFRANGTVRLSWYNDSTIGWSELDGRLFDVNNISGTAGIGALGWKNCIRLKGRFSYRESEYASESTKYRSGRLEEYKSEQTPVYELELSRYDSYIHNIFRSFVLQSDDIFITDYNKNNIDIYKEKNVALRGGYSPNWFPLNSAKASVSIEFDQKINRLEKRC